MRRSTSKRSYYSDVAFFDCWPPLSIASTQWIVFDILGGRLAGLTGSPKQRRSGLPPHDRGRSCSSAASRCVMSCYGDTKLCRQLRHDVLCRVSRVQQRRLQFLAADRDASTLTFTPSFATAVLARRFRSSCRPNNDGEEFEDHRRKPVAAARHIY